MSLSPHPFLPPVASFPGAAFFRRMAERRRVKRGNAVLLDAVRAADAGQPMERAANMLRQALEQGGDPNDGLGQGPGGMVPLAWAVEQRHWPLVVLLLNAGANPDPSCALPISLGCDGPLFVRALVDVAFVLRHRPDDHARGNEGKAMIEAFLEHGVHLGLTNVNDQAINPLMRLALASPAFQGIPATWLERLYTAQVGDDAFTVAEHVARYADGDRGQTLRPCEVIDGLIALGRVGSPLHRFTSSNRSLTGSDSPLTLLMERVGEHEVSVHALERLIEALPHLEWETSPPSNDGHLDHDRTNSTPLSALDLLKQTVIRWGDPSTSFSGRDGRRLFLEIQRLEAMVEREVLQRTLSRDVDTAAPTRSPRSRNRL